MSTGDEADGVHATSNSLSEQAKNDKKRKRASKWSEEETIALLESLRDLVQKSEAGEQCVKGSAKWEHISQELSRLPYEPRVAKSVSERWDTLRQAYLNVEKHLIAGKNFEQALRESRKEFKFLPADYTDKWHTLAAGCGPKQKKEQGNSGAELAMVENTVAKQQIIDALPCDVSPASISIPQALHKHISSMESLLSRSRDPVTDEPGDFVRSLLSIIEEVEACAKFQNSELYYSLEIDKQEWKSVRERAFSLLQDHRRRSRPTPRDANSSLPEQALERFQGLVYPQNDPDPVTITQKDIRTLNPSEFLNDTIIDFYNKYLLQTLGPQEGLPTLYIFRSFFFQKLAQTDTSYEQSRAAFERVKKWTKEIPIFEKDYIFIPVNQRSHWSLIIICHPGHMCNADGLSGVPVGDPCILHLDSCEGTCHTGLEDCIKNYLSEEWKERNPDADPGGYFDEIHFISAMVPQQDNQYDCGIFLLHYVELFLKVAPTRFSLKRIRNLEPNFLRRGWFKPSEASAKRPFVQKLIIFLAERRSAALLKDAEEARDCEASGGLSGTSLECEQDTHKSDRDLFPGGSQFSGPKPRERRDFEEEEILPDTQLAVTQPQMLVGSGRETPPSETHHEDAGPMQQYLQTVECTHGLDTSLQRPCLMIEDPTMCQTTSIAIPAMGMMKGLRLYYINQGHSLMLWGGKFAYILKDLEYATSKKGTLIPASSWQMLCGGVYAIDDHRHRDCKDGKDGMRVVESTSISIVTYDVLDRKLNPQHSKVWSPLLDPDMDIEHDNQEMDEDQIGAVLLHPDLNIIFCFTKYGVVGAYDFENEKLIGKVHQPQLRGNFDSFNAGRPIFSIVLEMLVFCCNFKDEVSIFTWTLNDEQVKRINGFNDHGICDLHHKQVQLLVTKQGGLAIYDLRQQKELHRWHTNDTNVKWIHDAKYSCDGELVYAGFDDSSIGVFDACLQQRCRITPSAYSPHDQWPIIWQIVAHPQERKQFAIRMWRNDVIYVIEPSHELGGEWVCKANQGVGRQIMIN